jgi:hypothetical protein
VRKKGDGEGFDTSAVALVKTGFCRHFLDASSARTFVLSAIISLYRGKIEHLI